MQKLASLAQQVETLRASSMASEGLFSELKTTIMRVEDLQAQVLFFFFCGGLAKQFGSRFSSIYRYWYQKISYCTSL